MERPNVTDRNLRADTPDFEAEYLSNLRKRKRDGDEDAADELSAREHDASSHAERQSLFAELKQRHAERDRVRRFFNTHDGFDKEESLPDAGSYVDDDNNADRSSAWRTEGESERGNVAFKHGQTVPQGADIIERNGAYYVRGIHFGADMRVALTQETQIDLTFPATDPDATILEMVRSMGPGWQAATADMLLRRWPTGWEAARVEINIQVLETREHNGEPEYQTFGIQMMGAGRSRFVVPKQHSLRGLMAQCQSYLRKRYEDFIQSRDGSGWNYLGVTAMTFVLYEAERPRIGASGTTVLAASFSEKGKGKGFVDPDPHPKGKTDCRYLDTCFINALLAGMIKTNQVQRRTAQSWLLDAFGNAVLNPDCQSYKYPEDFPRQLNLQGLHFPMQADDVHRFMEHNPSISVVVYRHEKDMEGGDHFDLIVPAQERQFTVKLCVTKQKESELEHFVALRHGIEALARGSNHGLHTCTKCGSAHSKLKSLERHIAKDCDDTKPNIDYVGGPIKPHATAFEDQVQFLILWDIETNPDSPDMLKQIDRLAGKLRTLPLPTTARERIEKEIKRLREHQERRVFIPNSVAYLVFNTATGMPVDPQTGEDTPPSVEGLPNVRIIADPETRDPTKLMEQFNREVVEITAKLQKVAMQRNRIFINRAHIDVDGEVKHVEELRKEAFEAGNARLREMHEEWKKQFRGKKDPKLATTWQEKAYWRIKGKIGKFMICQCSDTCHEICTAKDLRPDHCHVSGEFREMMFWLCNLKKRTRPTVHAKAHNAAGFDHHFLNEMRLRTPEFLESLSFGEPCAEHANGLNIYCKRCRRYGYQLDNSMGDRGVKFVCHEVREVPRCMYVAHELRCHVKCSTHDGKETNVCHAHWRHAGEYPGHDGVHVTAPIGDPVHNLVFSDSMKDMPSSLNKLNNGAVPKAVKAWRRARPGMPLPPHLLAQLRQAFPVVSQACPNDTLFELLTAKNLCPHEIDEHHRRGAVPYGLREWWAKTEFAPPDAFGLKADDKQYLDGKRAWDTLETYYRDEFGCELTGWDYYLVYLRGDVLQLADAMKRYRDSVWTKHKFDPIHYPSISAVGVEMVVKSLNTIHERPPAAVAAKLRERGIIGGYCSAPGRGHTKATHWDVEVLPGMPTIRLTKLDFASLYPTVPQNYPMPAVWDEQPLTKEDADAKLKEIAEHDHNWLCEQNKGVLIDCSVRYSCGEHTEHESSCAECCDMRARAGSMPACIQKRPVLFREHGFPEQCDEIEHDPQLRREVCCDRHALFDRSCGPCKAALMAFANSDATERFTVTKVIADVKRKRVLLWAFDYQYYVQKKHVTVEDVHQVWAYEQSWAQREAYLKLIQARRDYVQAGNPAMGESFKNGANGSIGKTMQDPTKYASDVRKFGDVYTQIRDVVKAQSDPRFKGRSDFGDAVRIELAKREVKSTQSLWGVFVYNLSKLQMRMFTDVLNDYFGTGGWSLRYTDTDSMVIAAFEHDGKTLYNFMQTHPQWFNMKAFPVWHSLHNGRFPKRCITYIEPDGRYSGNGISGVTPTTGHGVLDLEDVEVPAHLGFCERHLAEQHACPACMRVADEPCEVHKWSSDCTECVAAANQWKDVPSMMYDCWCQAPKCYRVRVVAGRNSDGTVKLKGKHKAKGVGRDAHAEVFNQENMARLRANQEVRVGFDRIGRKRYNDGTNPPSTKLIRVEKRACGSGIGGRKGVLDRAPCQHHGVWDDKCAWCLQHEIPFE